MEWATDRKTGDYTDFSGCVKYNHDGNCINGALREFKEETLEIFGDITGNMISHFKAIYDERNLVIFIRLEIEKEENENIYSFLKKFRNKTLTNPYSEISSIELLTPSQFRFLIDKKNNVPCMYEKLRIFLIKARLYKREILESLL